MHLGTLLDPGERHLGRGRPVCGGDLVDRLQERGVGLRVVAGEARLELAEVVLPEVLARVRERPGQKAPAERRVRHEGHAQLHGGGHGAALDVPAEERPLGLEGGDRVHGVRLAQFRTGHLAQPELLDLALPHQLGHRTDGLGQRDRGVAAVHVVEVDDVGVQPPQAVLHGFADVRGVVAHAPVVRVVPAPLDGELGGEGDLVAVRGDEGRDERLVGAEAVDVGGVEERDTGGEGRLQRLAGGGLVGVAVELAHAHAAETLDTDLRASGAELRGGDLVVSHQALGLSGARRAPA